MPKFDFKPEWDDALDQAISLNVGKMVSDFDIASLHSFSLQKNEPIPQLYGTYLFVFAGATFDPIKRRIHRSFMFMDDEGEVISLDFDEMTLYRLRIAISTNEYTGK